MMILGEKIGMTRIFDKDNKACAVSIVKVEPNTIIANYSSIGKDKNFVQIGFGTNKHNSKPLKNHLKKANLENIKYSRQFTADTTDKDKFQVGEKITLEQFKIGESVNITGISKGKGFAGVMKRHGFSGMPASHGHEKQRIPGSIGCRFPQRVVKGKRMAGHMGQDQITIKNLQIIDIDLENDILALKGSIPGKPKTLILISKK